MSNTVLNTAVVGCGIFGEIHAATYSEFPASRLTAVCDSDPARADAFARRFACKAYTSVDELAADRDVQAVSIATPDFAHRSVAEALMKAGKHVLIEKPLATSVADARAIVVAAQKAGVIGMVDFHNRYHPAIVAVKGRLDAGVLGKPQMLFARLSDRIEVATRWFPWAGRSGPEWFLGSHLVDVTCLLFGARPHRVFAEGRKDVLAARGVDCYDSMHIHLSFPEGFATLETSWIMPDTWPMICDFSVSLQTTTARADVDMNHQGVTLVDEASFDRPMLYGRTAVGADRFGFFAYPIHDFVRTILSGAKSPMPLSDGLANVRILAAAVESARTGKIVELTPA
ncbi:MAG: Gfo/Idh/MocA family oxidoreductase [Planctomycetota bacterium]|nr:Gfo/Idh/MocA family oxidoreductase [Planctomycetota bacterium]